MGSLLYLKLSVTKTELFHILQKKSIFPCTQNFSVLFFLKYIFVPTINILSGLL